MKSQPKFIVFLAQLLLLFKFCPTCKADNPLVELERVGTMAKVNITCANERCQQRHNTWRSQPDWENTRIPAGNFLLSFAILLAGGSATKILHVFKLMGVSCTTLSTYFRHQRVSILSLNLELQPMKGWTLGQMEFPWPMIRSMILGISHTVSYLINLMNVQCHLFPIQPVH